MRPVNEVSVLDEVDVDGACSEGQSDQAKRRSVVACSHVVGCVPVPRLYGGVVRPDQILESQRTDGQRRSTRCRGGRSEADRQTCCQRERLLPAALNGQGDRSRRPSDCPESSDMNVVRDRDPELIFVGVERRLPGIADDVLELLVKVIPLGRRDRVTDDLSSQVFHSFTLPGTGIVAARSPASAWRTGTPARSLDCR